MDNLLATFFILSYSILIYVEIKPVYLQLKGYERINDFENLKMNDLNILNCTYPMKEIHVSMVLVFLLSRDRLYATYYSIKYWLKISSYINTKIIILDHNSSYKPLLELYKTIEIKFGIKLHYLKKKKWAESIGKEIPNIIIKYLKIYKSIKYYILSDIDIIMINIPKNILDFYSTILDNCNVNVVGPSLMVNDISSKFPDYKKVYNFETKYISTNHYDVLYKKRYYTLVKAGIDTIFGMRKRETAFVRLSTPSYRSLSPYIAHHIDWYISKYSIPKSFVYYVNRTNSINHSGSAFNFGNSLKQP